MGIRDYLDNLPRPGQKCLHQRIWMAFICFLGLTVSYVLRYSLSMVITVMVNRSENKKIDPDACAGHETNTPKTVERKALFDWDEHLQGIILSSFFWGYVVTQIPGGIISDRYGPWYVCCIGIFLSSLLTLVTPLMTICFDYIGLIIVRILLGLSQGVVYASLHTIVAVWIPPGERGRYATLVFSGAHFGNFVSTLSGGWILHQISRSDWPLIFYFYGTIGLIWVLVFVLTTYSAPIHNRRLTLNEAATLIKYTEEVGKSEHVTHTPYKKVMTSLPVYAIIFAMIGHDWGLFALVIDLPKFLHSVLHFDIRKNGSLMASGYFLIWSVGLLSGVLVDILDKKKVITRTVSRKIFTTIGSVGPSVGMLLCSYAGCNVTRAVAFLIIGMAFMGAFYPSLKVNPMDLSPNHAGFLGALGHGIGGFSGIIVPYLVGYLTPNSFLSEWRIFFWITFIVMSLTNILYIIFASAKLQPWNDAGYVEAKILRSKSMLG